MITSSLNMLFQLQRSTVLPLPIRYYCDQKLVRLYGKIIVTYLNTIFRVSLEHSEERHTNLQSGWTDISNCSPSVTNQYWRYIKLPALSLLRSSVSTAVYQTKGPLSLPSILTRASNYIIVLRRHSQTLVPHVYAVCCNYTMFTGGCVSTVTRWIEVYEVNVKIGNFSVCHIGFRKS